MKLKFVLFLILYSNIQLFSQTIDSLSKHHIESFEPTTGPSHIELINGRIYNAAVDYQQYAPIPRVAFFDIAYPSDSIEFQKLNGFALILISSFSQTIEELPLENVYLMTENDSLNLSVIAYYTTSYGDTDIVTSTFGKHRTDAIYLIPVYYCRHNSTLFIDYAKNRKKFKLFEFSEETYKVDSVLPDKRPNNKDIIPEYVGEFMFREYPEFIDE